MSKKHKQLRPLAEVAAELGISEERIALLRSQAEAHDKHMAEVRANPLVQEAQRIYRSSSVLFGLMMCDNVADTFCPICGESGEEHLRFTCHPDMTIEEAYHKTMENWINIVKKRKSQRPTTEVEGLSLKED